ncbi:hypothetical protein PsYK624_135790 [Phanerochaete sordida]|uniref:Uncharacterized protein n=1 Tax=Phanerochaete sordida TaxID=48140 RepID=A0A9P3LJI3_9APHY|nr:hypothetical protein PsYK624_135790 [Phanerochaete sordida]
MFITSVQALRSVLTRFHDTKKVSDAMWEQYMKARRALAAKLFGKDTNFRLNTIQPSTSFASQLWDQHPQLALICGLLDQFRALLVDQYQRVERQPGAPTFASAMAGGIHDRLAELLRRLSEERRYARVNGKNLWFSGQPAMLAQQREELQAALDAQPQTGSRKRGTSEGADGPRKKLNAARGNAYTQKKFMVKARAGVSDSVGEAYKQR